MKRVYHFVFSLLFVLVSFVGQAQIGPQLVDKVVAVIGGKIILQSEVNQRITEYMSEKVADTAGIRCKVLEDLMYEKLLLIEAEKDSTIIITEDQISQEFTRRMNYYIQQLGSKEAFEKWYGKSVEQYKEELKPDVRDLLMAQQMRGKVVDNLTVSPEDVRKYYASIPVDSIPGVDAQEEIAQIVKMPALTKEEKAIAKQKCEDLRQQVLAGKDMATLAVLYSDDPGSASKGGTYKNVRRGEFGGNEFEKQAFSMKDSEISKVFETQFGYHFIQLIKRHGELLDLRHILIVPLVSAEDMAKSKDFLDSIEKYIKKDSITFSDAAARYSDDKPTKYNGGIITNPQTGLSKWDMNQLGELELSYTMYMNPGDVSDPELFNTPDAKKGYRIILLKNRTKPHKANLKDDYQQIMGGALAKKQQKVIGDWINRKLKEGVYVHIDKDYQYCKFQNHWLTL